LLLIFLSLLQVNIRCRDSEMASALPGIRCGVKRETFPSPLMFMVTGGNGRI
jgi:hypothetical protein